MEAMLLSQVVLACAWWRQRSRQRERDREDLRGAEELQAYERFELRMPVPKPWRELGGDLCRLIAARSIFSRVAVVGRGEENSLEVLASAGMDDVTVHALNAWAKRVQGERRSRPRTALPSVRERIHRTVSGASGEGAGLGPDTRSFEITLGPGLKGLGAAGLRGDLLQMGRATVVPCWGGSGRMLGAIVVCGNPQDGSHGKAWRHPTRGLEALAIRVARAIESSNFAEKLMEAERMASLGQIAGGVAHALNNPLTAVLGFAELIAETAEQPRVQKDAETIALEARRMRETVQRLLNFSRPGVLQREPVNVADLLEEMAEECRERLAERGIRLIAEVGPRLALVRGNRDRLRQVVEHLLNNASQAIAAAQMRLTGLWDKGEEHSIRLAVVEERGTLQLIVSDTGIGFCEPARVFDPYNRAQQVSEGAGLGLSISYAIVREHGGEISAFNLQHRGACVVVELPLARSGEGSDSLAVA